MDEGQTQNDIPQQESSQNDEGLPDIEAILDKLDHIASDLRMVGLPEGVDTLYDPEIVEIEWDLIASDQIIPNDKEKWKLDRLFNPAYYKALDRLAADLTEAIKNYEPEEDIPDLVLEIERDRILSREILIDSAMHITEFELALNQWTQNESRKSEEGMFDLAKNVLNDLKRQLLGDWSYLYGGNENVVETARKLLDGTVDEDTFRQEMRNLLPPVTWK